MATKYFTTGRVTGNEPLTAGGWRALRVECPAAAAGAAPGRFAMLRAWGGPAPLLARPISFAGVEDGGVALFWIKQVGEGTRLLATAPVGSQIHLTGPLGRGFTPPAPGEVVYYAAGSVGAAPLRFAAATFPHSADSVFFYGCAGECDSGVIGDPALSRIETVLTTDDGSAGEKGLVTTQLERGIARRRPNRILACGRPEMLKAVAAVAARHGIFCEVSTESYMGCGFGACMGCAVPLAQGGYAHACTDGPVFDSKVISWEGKNRASGVG